MKKWNLINSLKSLRDICQEALAVRYEHISRIPFLQKKRKARKYVNDREYIDHYLAYGPLVLGHDNEEVKGAVREQIERGLLYGTPHEKEIELAKKIISHYSSVVNKEEVMVE